MRKLGQLLKRGVETWGLKESPVQPVQRTWGRGSLEPGGQGAQSLRERAEGEGALSSEPGGEGALSSEPRGEGTPSPEPWGEGALSPETDLPNASQSRTLTCLKSLTKVCEEREESGPVG